GCATPMPRTDDPHEAFNRKMYSFNAFADRVALRPVAVGYRKITNETTRRLVSNFFANIESPITIANDLLQANPKEAFKATSRLVINTTVGILGLFDPASEMSIDASTTDLGVTLAKWGVPEGPYLVLPLFGSTTVREAFAFPIDRYMFDPLCWYSAGHSFEFDRCRRPARGRLRSLRVLSRRLSPAASVQDLSRQSADGSDPVAAGRRGRRRRCVAQGAGEVRAAAQAGRQEAAREELSSASGGSLLAERIAGLS